MKRDMDLARQILLRIEEQPTWGAAMPLNFDGYTIEEVQYHLMLLYQVGLIQALNESSKQKIAFIPLGLTWQGHEFLDASRDEKRWKQATEVMAKAGGFVLEVAKPLLIDLMKAQVAGMLT